MRKALDLILVTLAVAGIAYGVYTIGHLVLQESDDAAIRSSGAVQTLTTTPAPQTESDSSSNRRRNVLIGGAVAGALVVWIALASLVGAMGRRRRRKRKEWRLRS